MTMSPGFRDYLLDQLQTLGPVEAKRMFGGGGLYLDGAMFGLVAGDVLYLKADDGNRAEFEARGMEPFTYTNKARKKPVAMSYHEIPDDVLEDPDALCAWAGRAWEAARRASAPRKNKKKKKKPKRPVK